MRRQTLIMAAVFAVAAVFMGWMALSAHGRMKARGPYQRLALGDLSLEVPAGFGTPEAAQFPGWAQANLVKSPIGNLLVAQRPAGAAPLSATYTEWFALPAYGRGPLVYDRDGFKRFFRELPLFGQGAYSVQKQERQLRMAAAFTRNGNQYWIQLETKHPFPEIQAAFHGILGSVKGSDGAAPEPALAASLAALPGETGWTFFQPVYLPFMLPLGILIIIFAVQRGLHFMSGRLPVQKARYQEPHVEVALRGIGKFQFLSGGIVVNDQAMAIYASGAPFVVIPISAMKGRVSTGTGWLGARYIHLDLAPPIDFRRGLWKSRGKNPAKLKIYTRNVEALARILGA